MLNCILELVRKLELVMIWLGFFWLILCLFRVLCWRFLWWLSMSFIRDWGCSRLIWVRGGIISILMRRESEKLRNRHSREKKNRMKIKIPLSRWNQRKSIAILRYLLSIRVKGMWSWKLLVVSPKNQIDQREWSKKRQVEKSRGLSWNKNQVFYKVSAWKPNNNEKYDTVLIIFIIHLRISKHYKYTFSFS